MTTEVLVPHDDGRWYRAQLLSQHRVDGVWRVTVTYSTGPGFRFWRGMLADRCRALPDEQDDQSHDAGEARDQADRQDDTPGQLVAGDRAHDRRE